METTEEAADKRLSDAVRQLAINAVFEQYQGHGDEAVVEDALWRELAHRGVREASEDWVMGVASDICHGHAYVMSAESMQTAAALERGEYPGRGGGGGDSPAAAPASRRAEADPPAAALSPEEPAARGRSVAIGVTVVGVLVALWAHRSRRGPRVR